MGVYRQALQQLRPNSRIAFYGDEESYEALHWKDKTCDPPTKDEVELLVSQLRPQWEEYATNRQQAYPSVEDQLDMLWHMINRGEALVPGCQWHAYIKRVKDQFPKPV